jgi:membrane protein implicated in regulation of membrane protease activity
MDWHSILETTFLVMFWVGLALTVVMSIMSGAFQHEIAAGSSLEGGVAQDLGGPDIETMGAAHAGHAEVGWSHGDLPGFSPWSPTVICSVLTGAGGIGWLCLTEWNFGVGGALIGGVFGGLALGAVTFGLLAWLFAKLQSTSHVAAADLIGRTASVTTAIDSGAAGAIAIEAAGARMVVPARAAEPAPIPEGATVEIVRVDGNVYQVKETRESWLARSKGAASL